MIHTGSSQLKWRYMPAVVFALSCMFLALLVSTIQPNVFFSGDGGLKYLVAQQINKPGHYTRLYLESNSWVSNIWKQGFYPFKPPFVYDSGGDKIISFPPFFQTLSAPLFRMLGYAGLYILPVISVVLLWVWFSWLLYRRHTSPWLIAAGLFCLSCCSPLTLYAAVYWEHTPAVLLLFAGVVYLVMPTCRPLHAIGLGCLTGLSAWLRPEALLLCLLLAAMVLYNQVQQRSRANLYFVISCFTMIALFLICNQFLYGDFLGAHGYQLVNDASTRQKLYPPLQLLLHLNAKQLLFFPVTIPVFVAAAYALVKKIAVPREVVQLLMITVLFSLIAPFFLPNAGGKQWGPRYFLFLVPVVLVAAASFINTVAWTSVVTKTWLWLIIPLIAYCMYLNGYLAFRTLQEDYAYRVRPCLQFVQLDTCKVVIVQNQFVAQEFAHLFHTKSIFLAEDAGQYIKLQVLLKAAHITEAIFIAHDKEMMLPFNIHGSADSIRHLGDYFVTKCNWKQ